METLTVVNCCIFILDSTDGQSEVSVWSTACKTIWSPWLSSGRIINEQFRSFSISLLVPLELVPIINPLTDSTWDVDGASNSRAQCSRLSHCDLASGLWGHTHTDTHTQTSSCFISQGLMFIEELDSLHCTCQAAAAEDSPDEDGDQSHGLDEDDVCGLCWNQRQLSIIQPSCLRTIKSPRALEHDAADAKCFYGNHLTDPSTGLECFLKHWYLTLLWCWSGVWIYAFLFLQPVFFLK